MLRDLSMEIISIGDSYQETLRKAGKAKIEKIPPLEEIDAVKSNAGILVKEGLGH